MVAVVVIVVVVKSSPPRSMWPFIEILNVTNTTKIRGTVSCQPFAPVRRRSNSRVEVGKRYGLRYAIEGHDGEMRPSVIRGIESKRKLHAKSLRKGAKQVARTRGRRASGRSSGRNWEGDPTATTCEDVLASLSPRQSRRSHLVEGAYSDHGPEHLGHSWADMAGADSGCRSYDAHGVKGDRDRHSPERQERDEMDQVQPPVPINGTFGSCDTSRT